MTLVLDEPGIGDWRTVICDLSGTKIVALDGTAHDRAWQFRLNRPSMFTFRVQSDDANVAGSFSDGHPFIEAGRRMVKCYRKELQSDATYKYVLRFVGLVWQVQDVGDDQNAWTTVTCYDPLVRLSKRFTLNYVSFAAVDGATIAKTLLDTTNAIAATGIQSGSTATTVVRTVNYAYRAVFDAIQELASAFVGFDLDLTYLDRTDGIMANLDFVAKKGSVRAGAVFGWGVPPNNVTRVERMQNMDTLANALTTIGATGTGGGQIVSVGTDSASISAFGRYEAVDTFSDITDSGLLAALTADELNFRTMTRELVQFVPAPGMPAGLPQPFIDWGLGDYIALVVGPRLRASFAGVQRVYGFDIAVSDDGKEVVNGIYTAQQ